jgi:hypothetical protein
MTFYWAASKMAGVHAMTASIVAGETGSVI